MNDSEAEKEKIRTSCWKWCTHIHIVIVLHFYLNKYREMYHFITENRLNVHCDATWLRFVFKTIFERKTFKNQKKWKMFMTILKKKQFKLLVEILWDFLSSLPLLYRTRNSLLPHACQAKLPLSTINHRRMKII